MSMRSKIFFAVLLSTLLLARGVCAQSAKDTAPNKESKDKSSDGAKQKTPSKSEENPFPGSDSVPSATDESDKPPASSDTSTPHNKSEENPFPGSSAAPPTNPGEVPEPSPDQEQKPAPGGSSSSGSSSSLQGVDNMDLHGDADPQHGRKLELQSIAPGPAELAAQAKKDREVGSFYMDTHNWEGAYARFKEAVALAPEDPDAAYGMAASALKLNKQNEAVQGYQLYLSIDPSGSHSKEAHKQIEQLSRAAK